MNPSRAACAESLRADPPSRNLPSVVDLTAARGVGVREFRHGLGPVTNLAARLSDAAAPGQILLSQRAYSAIEDRVEAQSVEQLQMKGLTHAIQAYELLRLTAP